MVQQKLGGLGYKNQSTVLITRFPPLICLMTTSTTDPLHTWDAFLKRWPLESLHQMTLVQYTQSGDTDCFVYWLESRTESLGSIWGGSAFKFGVYSRKDLSDKESTKGLHYDGQYGWLGKYGNSAEVAFEKVRSLLCLIAQAAHKGRLAEVEKVDLGTVTKWKIAFLYQNRQNPCVLPIYKQESLQTIAGAGEHEPCEKLHAKLMEARQGQELLAYGQSCLGRLQEIQARLLTTAQAHKYLETSERFLAIKEPTEKFAGFRCKSGKELVLALDNNTPTLYLSPGPWLTPKLQDVLPPVVRYEPEKSRNSNIAANGPSLAQGHAMVKVTVPTLLALEQLCDAYFDSDDNAEVLFSKSSAHLDMQTYPIPLNQILYGPPGTGKTYATVARAVEILNPDFYAQHEDESVPGNREALKREFDRLSSPEQGRVRFVTFHQSFSYEDFVEGIRAVTDDVQEDGESPGGLAYRVEAGVFKRICDDAKRDKVSEAQVGIRPDATVWKMSIEEAASDGVTRNYCFNHGEARIGWENAGDLLTQNFEKMAELGGKEKSSLRHFGFNVQLGDVVVCLKTVKTIQAVGVVTGSYQYESDVPPGVRKDYVHKLPIHWLATGIDLDVTALNGGKQLTLQTVYRLWNVSWPKLHEALLHAKISLNGLQSTVSKALEPYVLIIDEINRGNVSRIFGELITLLEPSKRAGAPEALEVVLPYSKERFSVPRNVHLLGTMNTADRSLAGLDVALRRRFVFEELMPQPELLEGVSVSVGSISVSVGELLKVMNQRIEALLDREHTLGHAYFMPLRQSPTLSTLAHIFRQQVLPLLQEYFFDDWERIRWVLNDHRKKAAALTFVQASGPSFDALFGSDVQVPRHRQSWAINADAFDRLDSYAAILNAAAVMPSPQAGALVKEDGRESVLVQ